MNNSSSDSFYGLGTHEWIGTILPYKSQQNQQDGMAGFGIRRRVAIMGYHPSDVSQIPDDQIVFALVALPPTAGSGAAGRKMSVRLTQGDVVLGKFLDGNAKQNPIILHVLGRTQNAKFQSGRFGLKTGFVGSSKQTNLNPPNPSDGTPSQEFNADTPEGTPSAIKGATKSNRSSSNAQRLMKKGNLLGGGVDILKSKAKNIGGSVIKKTITGLF
jgi:hypothetical protein